MASFYPNIPKAEVPRAWRTTSLSGKTAGGGHTGQLDPLPEWEGYRVFRHPKSQTGWIDFKGHVIDAVDTHGSVLQRDLKTGKLIYYTSGDSGGLFGSIGSVLGVFGGDIFGLALEATGNEQLNAVRVDAGIAAAAGLATSGFASWAGLPSAGLGVATEGSVSMASLSDILGTNNAEGLPDWLRTATGVLETGLDIYGRITSPQPAPVYPPPPQMQQMASSPVSSTSLMWLILALGAGYVVMAGSARR